MRLDPNRISDEVIAAGEEWCDREAAARHLEEAKASVRAELACKWMEEGDSATKAAEKALASPAYQEHLTAMVEARRKANLARVLYDGMRLRADLLRTEAATLRSEMNLR
jgi:hypothetical protein